MTKEQAMIEYEYAKVELSFYESCYKKAMNSANYTLAQSWGESYDECASYMDYLRTQIYEEN